MEKRFLSIAAFLFVIATAEAKSGVVRGQYSYADKNMKGLGSQQARHRQVGQERSFQVEECRPR